MYITRKKSTQMSLFIFGCFYFHFPIKSLARPINLFLPLQLRLLIDCPSTLLNFYYFLEGGFVSATFSGSILLYTVPLRNPYRSCSDKSPLREWDPGPAMRSAGVLPTVLFIPTTEYTECQAFSPFVRIGPPHSFTQKGVLPPPRVQGQR
jgi:hypothetical protein